MDNAITNRTRCGIAVSPRAGKSIAIAASRENTNKKAKISAGSKLAKVHNPFRNQPHKVA